jgi:transposase-like protein
MSTPTLPTIVSVAAKIGCTAETLRRWVRGHA